MPYYVAMRRNSPNPKKEPVHITLSSEVLDAIDREAKENGLTRSACIEMNRNQLGRGWDIFFHVAFFETLGEQGPGGCPEPLQEPPRWL